ncbi:hypothetical protein AACH06_25770 [Ideonella sp. DXS29W]|uniref:Uncharacterized protein n=1 Tax=Ideonella lacteola TaxID=2984193 RepID=A0ABU9BWW9_9BURK
MMKWAVDSSSLAPVYVGSLARTATGLACGCRCPHCGATLQAVNAGVPVDQLALDGRQDQHFRHHGAQQQDRCKISVAERAALNLLLDTGEILLPAPTKLHPLAGMSGATYEGHAVGQAETVVVRRAHVVDEAAAELTLEDGRKLLVVLQGARVPTDTGQWSAVIEIQVNDAEVALWSPEQIMNGARLRGDWLCYRKHWQDAELQELARRDAYDKALAQLDPGPDEVDLPEWLSSKQRSECLLHWQIKRILAAACEITVPGLKREVKRRMPNGQWESEWAILPESRLALSDLRWEPPMEGFKPDIACNAVDLTGSWGTFELIIEVAVSHRVDGAKLAKIAARRLACIELYAERIAGQRRIHVDELRRLVLQEPSCKRWLSHSSLEQQVLRATDTLERRVVRLEQKQQEEDDRRAIAEAQRRTKEEFERQSKMQRQDWVGSLAPHRAARELLKALCCQWAGDPLITGNGMVWTTEELRTGLQPKGLAPLLQANMIRDRGPLWLLYCVSAGLQRPNGRPLRYEELRTIAQDARRWLHLLLCAIDVYQPLMTKEDASLYGADRARVSASIDQGSEEFVRPGEYDKALEVMFPELAAVLLSGEGTEEYAAARRSEIAQQEQEARKQREREENEERLRKRAWEEERNRVVGLEQARVSFAHQFDWNRRADLPKNMKQAIGFARTCGQHGDAVEAVIRSAWAAREAGTPIASWLQDQAPSSSEAVAKLAHIVEVSWVAKTKRP